MCGIIAAASTRNVGKLLVQGLHKMEYRGYDSAGIALHQENSIAHLRTVGKVQLLEEKMIAEKPKSKLGIAHTRWATHGEPSEANAHPHKSKDSVYIVHNGIIENYVELRESLIAEGYDFTSQTDSELIAHLLDLFINNGNSMIDAMYLAKEKLDGAYAIAAIDLNDNSNLVVARNKSPLLIGLGTDEMFAASDPLAIAQLTNDFIFLEDGDVASISAEEYKIYDSSKVEVTRDVTHIDISSQATSKGDFRHFMEKEIYEQPEAVSNTIDGRIGGEDVLDNIFGLGSSDLFSKVERIQIVACGTSLHAGRVAANWLSSIAELPCQIDYASEYRYRNPHVDKNSLLITISQSGETADTLAALNYAREKDYLASLTICNVPTSSLARESDFSLFTNAGPEIGVASTKAFTTQLAGLMLLTLSLAKSRNLNPLLRGRIIKALRLLPETIAEALLCKEKMIEIAPSIANKDNALFLGRGIFYPIAKEGALKLKEISYIHAEAYPAGELKHGPLALIDENMPVIALAPESEIAEKLISNLEEVKARGGTLYVFADPSVNMDVKAGHLIHMPKCDFFMTPIVYNIPLQILSYEVALLRGTDIDQPRNLAKSVTVE
ncbi:glutamine--fructose-6-phosphate transaminase (isomerizing) [Gammaproteobacteria bacterium]|nr:glutamine--fructose-6-phosphate transaminase (isomerizing) [Gammaproteobacteria bacterium]MDA9765930.1 glutamine--fructose-6-phosphate transaminase (isomerizing) [Gammaproteobacteria bacterium]MDA9804715.1 glutamine--fructose-6-phosphate transaminase (isomerizing) [Gammaproteobacteria bacterium]MDC0467083.1 glutamine--fructose-6-phosphate transaminase (isomerizing) [Gammaproteobacteria bacterium]